MSETLYARIKHRFDERFELDITLEVPPGITVLQGPSGSGKTTALLTIAGLLKADTSDIRLGATNWAGLAPEARRVSFVFQSLALFPHMTVRENVQFGPGTSNALATEWIERMRVSHLATRKPKSLSGGEAQRVALARGFARQPRVLLLDEPFSALDNTLREELITEVQTHVAKLAIPTVLVTHDPRDATTANARVTTIR